MSAARVLVPLAQGFEEIEAVALIDVLRRAEVVVVVAGLSEGSVTGSHGITLLPDVTLASVAGGEFDLIALPGGMPGATHLRDDPVLQALLKRQREGGRRAAAICAAPIALGPSGFTAGRRVTSYPGFQDGFVCASYVEDRVVVDGPLVTSRGPGTAVEFALALVAILRGADAAEKLEAGMLVHQPPAAPLRS